MIRVSLPKGFVATTCDALFYFMAKFVMKDLTGLRYGKLIAIKTTGKTANGAYIWLCKCDCGNETTVSAAHLLRKRPTRSCGCLKKTNDSVKTHGLRKHPLYGVWRSMKGRCINPNYENYPSYGGRGITVCEAWEGSFKTFYDDMIDGYAEGLILDRRDNDGNYSKENCRWATDEVSRNNKRTSL